MIYNMITCFSRFSDKKHLLNMFHNIDLEESFLDGNKF